MEVADIIRILILSSEANRQLLFYFVCCCFFLSVDAAESSKMELMEKTLLETSEVGEPEVD